MLDASNEDLRKEFKPEKVRVLFVGESRPVSEKFFYRGNTSLYRNMRDALIMCDSQNFLKSFKNSGFYLDDLVLEPINQIKKTSERRKKHTQSIPSLANRVNIYKPSMVISLLYSISDAVEEAIHDTDLKGVSFYKVPFPGFGQQKRFREEMSVITPQIAKLLSA